jgi:hypothetical protein
VRHMHSSWNLSAATALSSASRTYGAEVLLTAGRLMKSSRLVDKEETAA